MKYIVLLRGINVGGKRKILMKDLTALLEKNKYQNVITYIQSGNMVLESSEKSTSTIACHISDLINTTYGFDVPTLVLRENDLLELIEDQPFQSIEDIKLLHITILKDPVGAIDIDATEVQRVRDTVFLYCPNGYSKTKYGNTFFEKKLRCQATTRTWKTILKLQELASPD